MRAPLLLSGGVFSCGDLFYSGLQFSTARVTVKRPRQDSNLQPSD
jgi:hypothetical protein